MDFSFLEQRLVERLRHLIHNGQWTERSLARYCGLSQPHLHNVLCGLRRLTPKLADAILQALGWSLLDLLEPADLQALLQQPRFRDLFGRPVPLLSSLVGPGYPWSPVPVSSSTTAQQWVCLPELLVETVREPALVRFAADPDMHPLVSAGGVALVELSPEQLWPVSAAGLYVVSLHGHSLLRFVTAEEDKLVFSTLNNHRVVTPVNQDAGADLLKAKVVWVRQAQHWQWLPDSLKKPPVRCRPTSHLGGECLEDTG